MNEKSGLIVVGNFLCFCLTGCKCSDPPVRPSDALADSFFFLPDTSSVQPSDTSLPWEHVRGAKIDRAVGTWGTDPWIKVTTRFSGMNWDYPYPYLIETSTGMNCGVFGVSDTYAFRPGYCREGDKRLVKKVYMEGRYKPGTLELTHLRVKLEDWEWVEGKKQ